ncbi:MAG: tyrosine-type recombinase/integrase [Myxococcota bacterium]
MATIQERTSSDGSKSYRVLVRLKGHPTQQATFQRKTDAKRWAQQTEAAIREGRFFDKVEARKHTLADLIDRYVRDVLPMKPKTGPKQRRQLQWWKQELGAFVLADVTPARLAEARDKLSREPTRQSDRRAPATVVRYLAALSHAFTIAVKEWGWLDSNPMLKVRKPKEPRGRVRFLEDDERDRLLEACRASDNAHLYPVVVLALSTGMRKGEILGLRWRDVDLERGRIVLHETKNGERRVVPLAGKPREVIREHAKVRALDTDLVFPGRHPRGGGPPKLATIRGPWLKAMEAAAVDDFRFHDLRHSAASYLAMNGATPSEIAAVLGHKTLQMVKRYAHLSDAHTATVVESMNARIFGGGE